MIHLKFFHSRVYVIYLLITVCILLISCSINGIEKPGTLHVASRTSSRFYILDSDGNSPFSQGFYTNNDYTIPPGTYNIDLNGSVTRDITIESNSQKIIDAGCITFLGFTPSNVTIGYPDGSYSILSVNQTQVGLFPGTYSLKINGKTHENIKVAAHENVSIPTGTLQVLGNYPGRYTLSDSAGRILGSYSINQQVLALQGIYSVNINGSVKEKVSVKAGKETSLGTGELWICGSGNSEYNLCDSLNRSLAKSIPVNTVLPLFSGRYIVDISKISKSNCVIKAGTETRILTGSVWVKGNKSGTFNLCDSLGKRLNTFTTGIQLDLFGAKYQIEICRITHTITITPEKLIVLETGILEISGDPKETAVLYNSTNSALTGSLQVNTEIDLHPGSYTVNFSSGVTRDVVIVAGKKVSISSI